MTDHVNNRVSANFLGIPVEALTYQDLFQLVDSWLRHKDGRSHHIACVNAYCTTLALRDARLARIYQGADIIGADGMPFVRWIQLFLRRPCDRLAAPDIMLQLAERARETRYTFYLYGAAPDVLEKMKAYLEGRFPHLAIIGHHAPPFRPATPEEDRGICAEINSLRPDIVCVGLGTPKQDYWIDDHLNAIRGAVFIACGATFDFFGGRVRFAPPFIRRSGFEWLFRLFSRDFKRLWKRYTYYNLVFLWHFALQLVGARSYRASRWSRDD